MRPRAAPYRGGAGGGNGSSQNPARQRVEQQLAPLTHDAPIAEHAGPASVPASPPLTAGGRGGSHVPFVQLDVQQSAPVVHAPATGVHTTVQLLLFGSQCFEQQSPAALHEAVWPRHAPGGSPQRPLGSHKSSSFVAPQQPEFCPFPQSSPVGRHVELATSTSHCKSVGSHTPEQQSAFAAQVSPTTAHNLAAQTPPKHPSEQQSCAVAQVTPSARHASRHCTTPA